MAPNTRRMKRPAESDHDLAPPSKVPRHDSYEDIPRDGYKPTITHKSHRDSRNGKDFHTLPYPLYCMPYDPWYSLHFPADGPIKQPHRCPKCRAERQPTAHARKLFLVGERLSWENEPAGDRDRNEELNWGVNYELGIMEPFMEDAERVVGGRKSKENRFYPYKDEFELKSALSLIANGTELTDDSWRVWTSMLLVMKKMMKEADANKVYPSASLPKGSEEPGPLQLPTPPSSLKEMPAESLAQDSPSSLEKPYPTLNYATQQDFYSLLDQIERTSFVGARFLEAYAEYLADDLCKDCWLVDTTATEATGVGHDQRLDGSFASTRGRGTS